MSEDKKTIKNRGLVNRTAIGNSIKNDLYEKLQKINNETQIPISKLLDRAIMLLINEYEGKKATK